MACFIAPAPIRENRRKVRVRLLCHASFKTELAARCRAKRYHYLPRGGMGKDTPMRFLGMFIDMFRELGAVDDEVQRLRGAIPKDDDAR